MKNYSTQDVISILEKMMPKEHELPNKFIGTDITDAVEFGMKKQENQERLVYLRAIDELKILKQ